MYIKIDLFLYFHVINRGSVSTTGPHIVDGFKIDPKSACPLGVRPEERTRKVFVGGLQAQTTEEILIEYFSQVCAHLLSSFCSLYLTF